MLLKVENLHKRFGGAVPVHALNDVSLEMGAGEMLALIGPSGAGKTSLLNIIATLDAPTGGRVLIRGTNVHRLVQSDLNRFRNQHLGFIFQDDFLLPDLTGLENVMLPGRIARRRASGVRRRAKSLLDRVGLSDRIRHVPGQLSGGQRQRVGIARALINEPSLLLADEPTARLDQATGKGIVDLLVELNRQLGVTILMVTHERNLARLARRVVELVDGKIISDRRAGPDTQAEPGDSSSPG